ncbi:hypothetical protein FACS1894137_03270 [Spirochaetia bacterium]|nr:hypothetical protein FACS1894137_03270 [Spirochaetia bacterium]
MKKFIGKCLVLFFLVLIALVVLNYLYIRTTYWKESVAVTTGKFKNVPEHIQLANVGSSHGTESFDYTGIPYRAFNFALSSQRHVYNYAVLEQYIEHFDKNAVLLIPISYFEITRIKSDFTDQRARYYRFLDKQHIESYSPSEKLVFDLFPVLTAKDTILFIIKDQPPPEKQIITMPETELIDNCDKAYKSLTTDTPGIEIEAGEEGFAYNKNWVIKTIELCHAHGIRPVLITTPITSILNTVYAEKSPDFFDTFYRFTREITDIYPSLPYFDYSHDRRFEDDFSLFGDSHHLNILGAEKFTAIVISDLQARGLLPF